MSDTETLPGVERESTPVGEFEIPAVASLVERRTKTLKHADTFAVFNQTGDVLAGESSPEGLYHRDTRHLSHFLLSIAGAPPILLSSTLRDDNATLTCDLTNPDLCADGAIVFRHDLIHIRRAKFLWKGACFERLTVRNFDEQTRRILLRLDFAADFADLFEVRGSKREQRGKIQRPQVTGGRATLAYAGLDGKRRETSLNFEPAPTRLDATRAIYDLELGPREGAIIYIEIRCDGAEAKTGAARDFFFSLRDARRALRTISSRAAAVITSNEIFNEAARRAVSDLYMLTTETAEGPYPYAGIPWFSTVFGRDAIITALQTLWMDPHIARGVIGYLAANQATEVNEAAAAEPGKILHEIRQGEMAELGEVPFKRYYGSVDSTPLFVMLAGAFLERTGDIGFIKRYWENIEAALNWMSTYGDPEGDGFVKYGGRAHKGLTNQGWKDSQDSIFHADGTLAEGPIALVEVQAYAYAAKRAGADIARRLGFEERADKLDLEARKLRQRFDEVFWDEELGTYIVAICGTGHACRVRTSNAGHALYTGIALPERAERLVRTLMDRSSFCGWGVRTVAAGEARYNPMSYHNGSVWPHDNAMIAEGFARYGYSRAAARIFGGLFDASIYIELRRLPELFCGFVRQRSRGPTFYPVACSPQAWAATAPLSLLASSLGLRFDVENRGVVFDRPSLPHFLGEVVLRNLSLGGSKVDVALRRVGTEVAANVLSRHGDIRVTVTS